MAEKIAPSRDCPPCPECAGPGILAENMGNGHSGPPEATLGCCACGHGWVGTPAEVFYWYSTHLFTVIGLASRKKSKNSGFSLEQSATPFV